MSIDDDVPELTEIVSIETLVAPINNRLVVGYFYNNNKSLFQTRSP